MAIVIPSYFAPSEKKTKALMQKCHELISKNVVLDKERLDLELRVDNMATLLMQPHSLLNGIAVKKFERELDGILGEIEEIIRCVPKKSDKKHADDTNFMYALRKHFYKAYGHRAAESAIS